MGNANSGRPKWNEYRGAEVCGWLPADSEALHRVFALCKGKVNITTPARFTKEGVEFRVVAPSLDSISDKMREAVDRILSDDYVPRVCHKKYGVRWDDGSGFRTVAPLEVTDPVFASWVKTFKSKGIPFTTPFKINKGKGNKFEFSIHRAGYRERNAKELVDEGFHIRGKNPLTDTSLDDMV